MPRRKKRKARAVALLSGGLDSVVATVAAAGPASPGTVALALTFDYGQRAAAREVAASRAVARALGVKWKRIDLPWLVQLLPDALRRGKGVPHPAGTELDSPSRARERARAVWVPNRNGVFLNIAAAYAEGLGAKTVVAGFNREEARSFPDNSAEFIERATSALALSTLSKVRVASPTAKLTKTGIVRLGVKLGAPVRHAWSCYGEGPGMCGECESCARLVRALREADAPAAFWPRALDRDG